MTPDQLFVDFEQEFGRRKFAGGLLIAMIDFLSELGVPAMKVENFEAVLTRYPRQELTAQGRQANTLIVSLGDRTLSLRRFYNNAENFFYEQKRFDYPSCAPHATQAWSQYERWLDALCVLETRESEDLRQRVVDYVLEQLPSHEFDPASVDIDPPLFQLVIEGFDLQAQSGEPTGAAYQGLVFGFLRADNPHLQVEVDSVRTGSRRRDRVGDIDAWEGQRLAITAEVKQLVLAAEAVERLSTFAAEATRRGAMGLVVALDFGPDAKAKATELGVRALDISDLLSIVELWDPMKQRTAVASMVYYVAHVERNTSLRDRLTAFIEDALDSVPSQ